MSTATSYLPQNKTVADAAPYAHVAPNRSLTADILKGWLILLVVFGHALQFILYSGSDQFWFDPIFQTIYMAHMPLFMAISGYFSPQVPTGIQGRRRIGQLLLPMLTWSIIATTLMVMMGSRRSPFPMLKSTFATTYWFLWALILSLLWVWAIDKLRQRMFSSEAAGDRFEALSAAVFVLLAGLSGPLWPEVLPLTGFVLPFFVAGRIVRRRSLDLRQLPIWLWLGVIVVFGVAHWAWQQESYIYVNGLRLLDHSGQIALMFLGSASASLIGLALALAVAGKLAPRAIGRMLATLGQISLQIYLAQRVVFLGLSVLSLREGWFGQLPYTLQVALCAAVTAALVAVIFGAARISARLPLADRLLWGRGGSAAKAAG